ncbi:unnamed protein product [Dicrocoelium dendriticum]|nr:unnamed protein product [Dicrocoelium dendriticum]
MEFVFYESPTQLYIHQIPQDPDGFQFVCASDGYPQSPTNVTWTILVGNEFAFKVDGDVLSLTQFALYGDYHIRCDATVDYPDQQFNLSTELTFHHSCELTSHFGCYMSHGSWNPLACSFC